MEFLVTDKTVISFPVMKRQGKKLRLTLVSEKTQCEKVTCGVTPRI
jgi:hypothetical protein